MRVCHKKTEQRPSLGRGKRTVLENMQGTLTLGNHNSVHTLNFTIILYKLCAMVTFEHLGPLLLYKLRSHRRLYA